METLRLVNHGFQRSHIFYPTYKEQWIEGFEGLEDEYEKDI